MGPTRFDFVNVVVAERGLAVTSAHERACRLETRDSDLGWFCDLDDGTPTDTDRDPAAHVRWVCPALRVGGPATGTPLPPLEVRRPGPHSDLGKVVQGFRRLVGRASDEAAERFAYTDPAGILDAGLRGRIESWPTAPHGDGVRRPAELWSVGITHEGLVVTSSSWWDSAPALDHQIGLGVDIARRLAAQR